MSEFEPIGREPAQTREHEFLEDNEIFIHAYGFQMDLNKRRYTTTQEALAILTNYINALNEVTKENNLLYETATLRGPSVAVPHTTRNVRTGGNTLSSKSSAEGDDEVMSATGKFFGFTGYPLAHPDDSALFRAVLGYRVIVDENYQTPNFSGNLLANGPIESTSVSFLEDSCFRALQTSIN